MKYPAVGSGIPGEQIGNGNGYGNGNGFRGEGLRGAVQSDAG
jgi:hypothetical protein